MDAFTLLTDSVKKLAAAVEQLTKFVTELNARVERLEKGKTQKPH